MCKKPSIKINFTENRFSETIIVLKLKAQLPILAKIRNFFLNVVKILAIVNHLFEFGQDLSKSHI